MQNNAILTDALNAWQAKPGPELVALVIRAGKVAGAGRDAISGAVLSDNYISPLATITSPHF